MKKHLESDFWRLIRDRLPGIVERLEPVFGSGLPDVYGTYEQSYFCELKVVDSVKEVSPLSLLRDSQIIWHKKHGRQGAIIFLLVKYTYGIKMYQYIFPDEYKEIGSIERNDNRSWPWEQFTDTIRFALSIS